MYYEFHLWYALITIAVIFAALQTICAYLVLLERKISAWLQDRIGPNRVGPFGLLQPLADGVKLLLKEAIIPSHVDKVLYMLAPAIAICTAMMAFAVVPFGPTTAPPRPPALAANASPTERQAYDQLKNLQTKAYAEGKEQIAWPGSVRGPLTSEFDRYHAEQLAYKDRYQFVIAPHIDIGILFILAVTSLGVYAVILGGWSSNNKYSMLGALRSSAQLISYEIPMGMSILGVVMLSKSLNLERIIQAQTEGGWNILYQPLAFVLFLTAIFAECNRLPFDLPEAEQELVGGYHTEYSGMKLGLFLLGEYCHMITTSFLAVILFFGGGHFPGIPTEGMAGIVLGLIVFLVKMSLFICFYMLVRWTIPRFRFDQLMGIAWRVLIPLSLVNVLAVMIVQHLIEVQGWHPAWKWSLLPVSLALSVGAALGSLYRPRAAGKSLMVTRGHERVEVTVR